MSAEITAQSLVQSLYGDEDRKFVTYSDNDDYDDDYDDDGIILDDYVDFGGSRGTQSKDMSARSATSVSQTEKKVTKQRKVKDRADRATTEGVLDPRTRMMILKLLNQQVMLSINGCISTGKEANVYYCTTPNGPAALKVYKTSILVFKDRERYLTGEHRFRNAGGTKNPRKMVAQWAEKELRNLKRLNSAGIPSPVPVVLKSHILLMSFIGKGDLAAPRLKDADLSTKRLKETYIQLVKMVRTMFWKCHLVHADLSEYNILYYKKSLYIIDVSQSVEHEHPMAMDFLRKDCTNVTQFYSKAGLSVMSTRELFDFVTNPELRDEDVDDYLDQMQKIDRSQLDPNGSVEEKVFLQAFIPRSLAQVNFEHISREIDRAQDSKNTGVTYQFLRQMAVHGKEEAEDEEEEEDDTKEHEEEDEEDKTTRRKTREPYVQEVGEDGDPGPQPKDKAALKEWRKANKKFVKAQNQAKRKVKIKKKDKKKKVKAGR